jgi:acetoin utilization protein AcuB
MRIRDWMTRDPIVVTPETPLLEAQRIMRQSKINHLPVVKRGRLVGIITRRKILEASPSSATTLSIHEISYLLTKMTVADVMERDVISVPPETTVEEILLLGMEKRIGSFPVVENGKLVGIATATEITRALVEILAAKEEGVLRLTLLSVQMDEDTFPTITSILRSNGAMPLSIISIPWRGTGERRIIIRCKAPKPKGVIDALKKAGFIIERTPTRRKRR